MTDNGLLAPTPVPKFSHQVEVVVPLNDAAHGDRAVAMGGYLAQALGARLHLVSVNSEIVDLSRDVYDLDAVAQRSRCEATYEALTTSTSVEDAVLTALDGMHAPLDLERDQRRRRVVRPFTGVGADDDGLGGVAVVDRRGHGVAVSDVGEPCEGVRREQGNAGRVVQLFGRWCGMPCDVHRLEGAP